MFKVKGGCHSSNVAVELELSRPPDTYRPRACDCSFCRKHGASYISDPAGALCIRVGEARLFGKYQQGSGTADCLLCSRCGVLIGVAYQEGGRTWAAINSRILADRLRLGEEMPVSPQTLDVDEKVRRWKELWFPDVAVISARA